MNQETTEIPNLTKVVSIINHNQPDLVSRSWLQRKFLIGFNASNVIWHDLMIENLILDGGIVNWEHKKLHKLPVED